jgi:hypothetical protein
MHAPQILTFPFRMHSFVLLVHVISTPDRNIECSLADNKTVGCLQFTRTVMPGSGMRRRAGSDLARGACWAGRSGHGLCRRGSTWQRGIVL